MERTLLSRIHVTIPKQIYEKLIEKDKLKSIDMIVTELLYDYIERQHL